MLLLTGIGFALCFATLNIGGDHRRLAISRARPGRGARQPPFQVGGAVGLAVVSAIVTSRAGGSTDHSVLLNAYQTALVVVTGVAIAGPAVAVGGRAPLQGRHGVRLHKRWSNRNDYRRRGAQDGIGEAPRRRPRRPGRPARATSRRATFRRSTGATCGNAEGGAMPPTPTRLMYTTDPGDGHCLLAPHLAQSQSSVLDAGDQHPAANHRASAPPLPTYPGAGGRSAKRVDRHHRPAGQSEQARDRPSWRPSSLQAR